ncbi:MAG: HesA/MoeB/ThiF family protein [Asgard group archaeon]|nr:HesA/MoeB/ThiF family protein [Asgard group archaeon]
MKKGVSKYYSRFLSLSTMDKTLFDKIRAKTITIVGVGGLGSIIAHQLTALGIRNLRLIDTDIIEESNLQRQFLYRYTDIGRNKVDIAKQFLEKINPDVNVVAINKKITKQTVSIVTKESNCVIDGLDNFETRFLVNKQCLVSSVPFVFGAVNGISGNTTTIIPGETICLECIFANIKGIIAPSIEETGIHPSILGIIGNIQVFEAIRIICDQEPLLKNKLLFYDLGEMELTKLTVQPKDDCICQKYKK